MFDIHEGVPSSIPHVPPLLRIILEAKLPGSVFQ
jgi:hypothetical protein